MIVESGGGGVLFFFLFLWLVYGMYGTCKASEEIRCSSIVGTTSGLRGMGGAAVGSRRPRNSPSKTEKVKKTVTWAVANERPSGYN